MGSTELRFYALAITIIFSHEPIMSLLLILLLLEEDIDHPLLHQLETALNPCHCIFAVLNHRDVLPLLSR